jgi:uncharacterized protein
MFPMLADTPIFPLSTVLFPGGVLPLRIFEARYMDMVRDCMQHERPFGVCLITRGGEVGESAEHEAVGCLASIRNWDMQQLGLLEIRTVGTQRFRILDRRVAANGLVRATLETIPDDPVESVPDEFSMCATLLERIVQDLERREPDPDKRMIAEPYAFDSAAWVANRLSEFLPTPGPVKHKLMVLEDPVARLALVHRVLEQHRVL